mgnify:CR=1 FL=1
MSNILDKKTKSEYLKDLNLSKDEIKDVFKKGHETLVKQVLYTTYKPSKLGAFANRFFEGFTLYLTSTYPEVFDNLRSNIIRSDLRILSKTNRNSRHLLFWSRARIFYF